MVTGSVRAGGFSAGFLLKPVLIVPVFGPVRICEYSLVSAAKGHLKGSVVRHEIKSKRRER